MRFTLIFCFIFSNIFSQEYTSSDTLDFNHKTEGKELFESKLRQFKYRLEGKYSYKVSSELLENLKDFKQFFSKTFDKGEYIYNTPFNEKIKEIYAEIYQKNTSVPKDFQLLISRDISLNAYCLFNGTMVVNIGAVHYLESEDQLAAIICHEIAHKLLDHSENSMVESVVARHSKESKRESRAVKKQKFNQQKLAFSILKEKLLNNSRENRQQELEADSLGFSLLKNTKYHPLEFLRALELSLQYDTIKPANLNNAIYKQVFDIPNLPFDEKWLHKEDFSDYDYVFEEKIAQDSIKSHPEIKERIDRLTTNFHELDEYDTETLQDLIKTDYNELRKVARKEQVSNLFHLKKYGFCIYLSLFRIEQDFMVDYHKKWLGFAFKEMYKARKEYMANKYLDRIDPENQSESYQQFINFMWNLRLEEIKKIADYYSKA